MALEIKRTPELKGKEADVFLKRADRNTSKKVPKAEVRKDLRSIYNMLKNSKSKPVF